VSGDLARRPAAAASPSVSAPFVAPLPASSLPVSSPPVSVRLLGWVRPGGGLCADRVARARELRRQRVLLDVVDTNPGARALYEGLGFQLTGTTSPYPHDDAVSQLQLALPL